MVWPFAATLAVAAFCGLSVLLITTVDMLFHKRGESLRPVRTFDIAIGLLLAGPALLELHTLLF